MSETKPDNLPKFDFSKLPKDYTRFDFWKDYVYCVRPQRQSAEEIVVVKTADSKDLTGALVELDDMAKHFGIPKSMLTAELNSGQRWPCFGGFDMCVDYTQCISPMITAASISTPEDLTDADKYHESVHDGNCTRMVGHVLVRIGTKVALFCCTTTDSFVSEVPSADVLSAEAVTANYGWVVDEDALENNPSFANFIRIYRPGEKIEGHQLHIGWVPNCWGMNSAELLTSSAHSASAIRGMFACSTHLREEELADAIESVKQPFNKARVGRYTRTNYCGGYINQICNWLARLHSDPNIAIDPSGEWLDFYNADNGKTIRLVFKDVLPKIIKKAEPRQWKGPIVSG